MTLAAVLQPTPLLGRPVLMTVFIAVLALSSFGLGGAIYNVVISTRRLADVPKPAGSPERVVAQGIRRIGIGRIVMLLAAIAFASIALAASIQNTFGMTANIFGAAFIAAICAPGVVTTVLTAFEINERIRIDRIYRALPTTATKRSERVASRRSELSSRSA